MYGRDICTSLPRAYSIGLGVRLKACDSDVCSPLYLHGSSQVDYPCVNHPQLKTTHGDAKVHQLIPVNGFNSTAHIPIYIYNIYTYMMIIYVSAITDQSNAAIFRTP